MKISCPSCGYQPDGAPDWNCQACGNEFDMFEQGGACPHCGYMHTQTPCVPWRGGCDEIHPHLDWYADMDEKLLELGIVKSQDR